MFTCCGHGTEQVQGISDDIVSSPGQLLQVRYGDSVNISIGHHSTDGQRLRTTNRFILEVFSGIITSLTIGYNPFSAERWTHTVDAGVAAVT